MTNEALWAKTTARRLVAETLPVNLWKRNEVRAIAQREQRSDERGNTVVVASVSLADILGAGFTPGIREGA